MSSRLHLLFGLQPALSAACELSLCALRQILLKILYPKKHGVARIGLSGRRRPMLLQPARVMGYAEDGDAEYAEMPRFAVAHEGWLVVKIGMWNRARKLYVSLKQGTLTAFEDHESLKSVISYNLAVCKLKSADSKLTITRGEELLNQTGKSIREVGRKMKGPLWGQDCMVLSSEGNEDALKRWAEKVEESMNEAKLVDAYKMQANSAHLLTKQPASRISSPLFCHTHTPPPIISRILFFTITHPHLFPPYHSSYLKRSHILTSSHLITHTTSHTQASSSLLTLSLILPYTLTHPHPLSLHHSYFLTRSHIITSSPYRSHYLTH